MITSWFWACQHRVVVTLLRWYFVIFGLLCWSLQRIEWRVQCHVYSVTSHLAGVHMRQAVGGRREGESVWWCVSWLRTSWHWSSCVACAYVAGLLAQPYRAQAGPQPFSADELADFDPLAARPQQRSSHRQQQQLHSHPPAHQQQPSAEAFRHASSAPLRKLSVDLIRTYKHINEVRGNAWNACQAGKGRGFRLG